MNELEDICVEVVEKYTLDGSNTFALMNTSINGIHMNDAITNILM